MSITLTQEQETRVKQRAAQVGKPVEVVLGELIDVLPQDEKKDKKTGTELVAELQSEGLFAPYGDITKTAQRVAQALRLEAETRAVSDA